VLQAVSHPRTRLALALVAVTASGAALVYMQRRGMPKRFGVVEEGRLYRCGEITPSELEHVTRKYGLRTVLSLLNPEVPESATEREEAERLGLRWVNVPLPGDGASTPDERDRIKVVLLDPAAAPLLVHCAAGTNRTGLAVGMYRIHQQGWTVTQVLAEMRRYGFEDLPKHENLRQALATELQSAQSAMADTLQAAQP
jgi:protein tyrosine/serine phosphatase